MTWTTPRTWVTGEIVTASEMNTDIRDNTGELKDTVQADGGGTLEHRHKSGTLIGRPPPGESGRLYLPTDLAIQLHDNGTEWLIGPHYPQKCAHFCEEFLQDYLLNWREGITGTASIDTLAAHPGRVRLGTGATSGSNAKLIGNSPVLANLDPDNIFVTVISLGSNEAASGNQYIGAGLMDTVPSDTANPNNGIFLRKNDAGNFYGVCRASASESTVDLGGTFSGLTVVIIERTPTGVKFYTSTWNAAGLQGAEVTSNVPTANLLHAFRIANTTAAGRSFDVGVWSIWIAR